jgi:hypothetical protein
MLKRSIFPVCSKGYYFIFLHFRRIFETIYPGAAASIALRTDLIPIRISAIILQDFSELRNVEPIGLDPDSRNLFCNHNPHLRSYPSALIQSRS